MTADGFLSATNNFRTRSVLPVPAPKPHRLTGFVARLKLRSYDCYYLPFQKGSSFYGALTSLADGRRQTKYFFLTTESS